LRTCPCLYGVDRFLAHARASEFVEPSPSRFPLHPQHAASRRLIQPSRLPSS
jgi:hypothetical protein